MTARTVVISPARERQQHHPSTAPTAEYVLIGPSHDLDEIARMFAEIGHPRPVPRPPNPRATVEVPTVRIRVWAQPDGARFVEVHDHRGESACMHVLSPVLRR